ncbi:OmpP1/FadL family transporter [Polaribacter tangerinus]|uniref:OmpP1/FadL family transporter n=1 Tax=Polaribacter tangerinus TaxID=1920034 RepID=UPI000B4B124C|nr:outer membrane protein transport protein [Polaribacter tangerinus]
MKKYIIVAVIFAVSFTARAQSLGYQDLALLFSENDKNGTARFTAMAGAFGALGGDVSAMNINPAGISVYNSSAFAGSFNVRSTDINANYYGSDRNTQDQFFNLSQAGAVLVFNTSHSSDWSKLAIGFNYRKQKDFNSNFGFVGNSNIPTFREFPLDQNNPAIAYDFSEEQRFQNNYTGEINEINLAFSSVHLNKLHLGASLNFYNLNFSQMATLEEFNNDGAGNTLEANFYQENFTTGTGVSLNLGFIYKLNKVFRFGMSYQTPTWYTEVIENTNIVDNEGFFGDTEIAVSNDPVIYDNTTGGVFPSESFIYQFRTPSKLTTSGAIVFGKKGLLSIDYTRKNYQNMKLSSTDFMQENAFFQNELRNTNAINIGTEWRLNRFSVRGGYMYEEAPLKEAISTDNLQGYSFGGGYDFGNFKIDFSYGNNNRTSFYNAYAEFSNINAAELQIDNSVFTATATINL